MISKKKAVFQNYSICDCTSRKIRTVVQVSKQYSLTRYNRIPDFFNYCYGDLVLFRNVLFDVPMILCRNKNTLFCFSRRILYYLLFFHFYFYFSVSKHLFWKSPFDFPTIVEFKATIHRSHASFPETNLWGKTSDVVFYGINFFFP